MAKRAKSATADLGLRVKEPLRAQIERAAKARGFSMNAEIVDRLEQSFEAEDLLQKARQRYAQAEAARDASKIQAIREAGFQLIRDVDDNGKPKPVQVIVSAEHLLAEADGILRSGFFDPANAGKNPTQIMIENAIEAALRRVAPHLAKPEEKEHG